MFYTLAGFVVEPRKSYSKSHLILRYVNDVFEKFLSNIKLFADHSYSADGPVAFVSCSK